MKTIGLNLPQFKPPTAYYKYSHEEHEDLKIKINFQVNNIPVVTKNTSIKIASTATVNLSDELRRLYK